MQFESTSEGKSKALIKGRLTRLEKQAESTSYLQQGIKGPDQAHFERNPMVRGSNGSYMVIGDYLGTFLYVHVTAYDTADFVFEGNTYCTPKRFILECYKNVLDAIGVKKYGNNVIQDKDMQALKERCEGKKLDIYMVMDEEPLMDKIGNLYAKVVLGAFFKDEKPLFSGLIPLEQVN